MSLLARSLHICLSWPRQEGPRLLTRHDQPNEDTKWCGQHVDGDLSSSCAKGLLRLHSGHAHDKCFKQLRRWGDAVEASEVSLGAGAAEGSASTGGSYLVDEQRNKDPDATRGTTDSNSQTSKYAANSKQAPVGGTWSDTAGGSGPRWQVLWRCARTCGC